jgi:hypothetical protein
MGVLGLMPPQIGGVRAPNEAIGNQDEWKRAMVLAGLANRGRLNPESGARALEADVSQLAPAILRQGMSFNVPRSYGVDPKVVNPRGNDPDVMSFMRELIKQRGY